MKPTSVPAMNMLERFARRYGGTRWFAAVNSKILPPIDRVVAKATGGKQTLSAAVAPTLLLVHSGRTSGEERRTPLVFVTTDDGHAVVGTNFGKPHHPHWALNLLAKPEAEVVLHGSTTPVRARPVTDEERAGLWPRFVEVYPGYADYAKRLDRDVHMFVLEPRTP
jgi:deazaflavin-dependent oxidoreductase (nitroreductase family)